MTSRYLLIIRDEDTFAEKKTIRLNYMKVIFLSGTLLVFSILLSFVIVITILSQWLDPRTNYMEQERQLIELEDKVNSMILKNQMQQRYIAGIKNLLTGDIAANQRDISNNNATDRVKNSDINFEDTNPVDSMFREEFEGLDYEKLAKKNLTNDALAEIFFFAPVNGVVSKKFNVKEKHYATDIVSNKNEPIKCVANGTVIMASWTQEAGHVIGVQHKNQLISFYKHNSVLFKEIGDIVKAGDILAIIGNSGDLTDGPHLHFELWYDGYPVDPEGFIVF